MPSKRRWALNPRKWFGSISNTAHKREKNNQVIDCIIPLPPPAKQSTRTILATAVVPRVLTSRSKTKITPILSINDNNNSAHTSGSFTRFQLVPFNPRREKTTVLLSSTTLFNQTSTFVPTRFEPSIRKNDQSKEDLSINAARRNTETMSYDSSKLPILSLQYGNTLERNSIEKQSEMNISNLSDQDLLDCRQDSSDDFINKILVPRRSHSSSSLSIDDNDTRDESSSSGVFTDERADTNDRYRKASKDTLSTLEVLSVESIADSQTSLNHGQSRPSSHQYRLPLLSLETIENKSIRLPPGEKSISRSYRAYSAENILKDNPIITPVIAKNRQSSAAIIKKIEKRIQPGRSPPITLEKAGFVRVTNDIYRLTTDKDDHLYRRQRQNSVIQYLHHEDSLPPADNEESYATLPRTSSTDQLNNNLQNDLRAIVDDCLRPVAASINKKTSHSTKTQQRSKRSQTNNEHTQINIEDLTDKLLSSVACSTYSQYQRCY
jgi:hypothetical protein